MRAAGRLASRAALALAMLVLAPLQAGAAACGPGSLQDYINLGAVGCTYQNLLFKNFSYDDSDGTERLGAGDIMVGQDSLNDASFGLMFSASWEVRGTDVASNIEYDVVAQNGRSIIGEILLINGAMLSCNCSSPPGDGAIGATEETFAASLETFKTRHGAQESDGAMFAARAGDSVATAVFLEAGPFSTAQMQSVSNLFTLERQAQAPEPGSLALFGAALVLAARARGQRLRRPPAGSKPAAAAPIA